MSAGEAMGTCVGANYRARAAAATRAADGSRVKPGRRGQRDASAGTGTRLANAGKAATVRGDDARNAA